MEVSDQLLALAALTSDKALRYLLCRGLDGTESLFGRGGEEKKSQNLPRIEPWPSGPYSRH
jgi:hypothetical protein